LTFPPARAYCVTVMDITLPHADTPARIKALDARLDALIKHARLMRRQAEKTASEHARLKIAQDTARTRIKTMIAQLKSLEQHT